MALTRDYKGSEIRVENGFVTYAGQHLGVVDHGLKDGYHAAIAVELTGQEVQWLEQDTPNLPEAVADIIRAHIDAAALA